MRVLLPVALLGLAVVLSGCSDGGSDPPADGDGTTVVDHNGHGGQDSGRHLLAPTWQVGQWWTLSSEQSGSEFTHVVSGDAGADWVLDTDNPDIAFFDARSDISFLGPVRKSDLAGSQGSDRVAFFQFPLTQGKTWTTRWDQQDIGLTAVSVLDGKAVIEAKTGDGILYAKYTYDAAIGYFRDYAFYAPDGTVGFAAQLVDSGTGFTGDLVRWSLTPIFEHHGGFDPLVQNFDIDPGFTDLWMSMQVACTTGLVAINVGALTGIQNERGYSVNGPCPATVGDTFAIPAPTQQELWGAQIAGGPVAQGTLDVTVLGRTSTTFKAGSAP